MTPIATVVTPPSGTFNLNIVYFWVTDEVELKEPKPIRFWLVVKNTTQVEGQGIATLVGVQNGVEFYRRSITVTDPVGGGYSSFKFPDATAMVEGKIIWTLTLVDNTNTDVRTRTTKVEGKDDDDDHEKGKGKYHRPKH